MKYIFILLMLTSCDTANTIKLVPSVCDQTMYTSRVGCTLSIKGTLYTTPCKLIEWCQKEQK
jgi:hypothetical protein